MTVFKLTIDGEWLFFKVNTSDLRKAVRTLFRTFGDVVTYDVL